MKLSNLSKIILTPVLFTSFILSLFFVNTRNRALRVEAHSSSSSSSLFSFLLPANLEPYQDHNDSRWSHRSSTGHSKPNDPKAPKNGREKGSRKKKPWHLHRKITQVAKLEVNDAFEMRRRVIMVMVVTMILSSAMLWICTRWLMTMLSARTLA